MPAFAPRYMDVFRILGANPALLPAKKKGPVLLSSRKPGAWARRNGVCETGESRSAGTAYQIRHPLPRRFLARRIMRGAASTSPEYVRTGRRNDSANTEPPSRRLSGRLSYQLPRTAWRTSGGNRPGSYVGARLLRILRTPSHGESD